MTNHLGFFRIALLFVATVLFANCGGPIMHPKGPNAVPLIKPDGSPNLGVWTGEINVVDPRDYEHGFFYDMFQGIREKAWEYIGIYTDEVIIGLAVVDTGYIGTVFCYIYDRKTKKLWETEVQPPFGSGIHIDRNVAVGNSNYDGGDDFVLMDNDIEKGRRLIQLSLEEDDIRFELAVELFDDFKAVQPLQANRPTSGDTFSFTHKVTGLPVDGAAKLGDTLYSFDPTKDFAVVDYTFGFPAYHTVWNWASFSGYADDGTLVGLNLVDPIQDDTINENGMWIGGKLHQLGKANYSFDPEDTLKPWKVTTADGSVDLTFTPLGKRQQSINMLVLSSQFQQPFGTFSGTLRTKDGQVYTVTNLPGVVEDHEAKW